MAQNEGDLTIDSAIEKIGFGRFQLGLVAICGIVQASDSMEMILLSFLGRNVQCEWNLSSQSVATLTTCVFVGTIFGGPIIGVISDRYGRWNALLLSACIIAYYGAMSAASPNFPWILILRAFVGFAIGGLLALTFTLTGEFLPLKFRAAFLVIMMGFWTIGGLIEVLVAWLSLGSNGSFRTDGWRRMMAATAVPLFLVLPFFAWLPRSPRFLLADGRPTEALTQLNRVAKANGHPEFPGPLTDAASKAARGNILGLFANRTLIRLTVLLLIIWACTGFLYYGLVLLTTELPGLPHRCLQNWSQISEASAEKSSGSCCQSLRDDDYATAAIATAGELLGYVVIVLFIDKFGRRAVFIIDTAALCCLMVCLMFCMSPIVLTVILFFSRCFVASLFTTSYIYTSEAYPTTIRTIGLGVNCAASRVGSLLSPFVAQVLLADYSVTAGLLTFAAAALVCTVAIVLLPFDTKGQPLFQTVEETEAAAVASSGPAKATSGTEADGLRLSGDPKTYSSLGSGEDDGVNGKDAASTEAEK